MNIFRLAGDLLHLVAIIVLLLRIWRSQTCAGISGRSQVLYAVTYISRYADLFVYFISIYNSTMKMIFIVSTLLTVYLIFIRFKSTYNYKKDTFRVWVLLIPAAMLSFFFNQDFLTYSFSGPFLDMSWSFSIYLESVAILPQLFMVAKIGRVEKVVIHYLLALWTYRSLYILNWIFRYYHEGIYSKISIAGGIVQTLLYGKFFYHYSTRASHVVQEKSEKEIEAEGNSESNEPQQMVLECLPGCLDSWLAPSYEPGCLDSWLAPSYESLDSVAVNEESFQPVKVMDVEPGKEAEVSKEVILPSTKV